MICAAPLLAAPIARSGPLRISLIEVYSSEGCGSCPPAEEWVSKLSGSPGLWKNFVPVVFHVDTWDYLGWKDVYSEKRFTVRQKSYAEFWKNGNIYTPSFVLNGREWRDWYKHGAAEFYQREKVGDLFIERMQDDRFKVSFAPQGKNRSQDSWMVHVALLGFDLISDIKSGENSGQQLKHDFTVIQYAEETMKQFETDLFESKVVLKLPLSFSSKELAIAAWVSQGPDPEPLQATGAYL